MTNTQIDTIMAEYQGYDLEEIDDQEWDYLDSLDPIGMDEEFSEFDVDDWDD